MKLRNVTLTAVILLSATAFAQTTNSSLDTIHNVVMTNKGIMTATDNVKIFVEGAVKTQGNSSIWLKDTDSELIFTGNFYHEEGIGVDNHAFKVDGNGIGVSNGKVVFRKDYAERHKSLGLSPNNYVRKITIGEGVAVKANFNRGNHYIAFPHIVIGTKDTVEVTRYMGIDALSITGNGVLLLTSAPSDAAADTHIWDASLRFPNPALSPSDVPAGKVAIERHTRAYRHNTASLLMPFATPYTNQRSGYFAGMFVRKPAVGADHYVKYPLADTRDADGYIRAENYVINPTEQFVPGQPYLISMLDSYGDLNWVNLAAVGSEFGDSLLFDGSPYNLGNIPEQIVTTEKLLDHTFGKPISNKYIVVGNSYTAPISVAKLNAAITASGVEIDNIMYVFLPGSSGGYTQFDRTNLNNSAFYQYYIPSQSIFMLVHKTQKNGGHLVLDRSLVEHARISFHNGQPVYSAPSHSMLNSSTAANEAQGNLLKFKVSPSENFYLQDVAAVFVRNDYETGKYDMTKYSNGGPEQFSLYMQDINTLETKRLQMGVPENTISVNMSFKPTNVDDNYTITASNIEEMRTQVVLLEDKFTGYIQDLRLNDTYEFYAAATDDPNRFVVHFAPEQTDDNPIVTGDGLDIYSFYNGNHTVKINNLNAGDINSKLQIIDMQGRIITETTVSTYPLQDVAVNLISGIYVVRISGARQHTNKFIVK